MSDSDLSRDKESQWWEFCPLCGARLVNQRCRLVCPNSRCQYFQSCSEFDL